MTQALYHYYERELLYIRQLAKEFALQYPATASRLLIEANRSLDPHVERLIEAFAFLTARVQQKLDDEYPELTEAMLGILYPHYLAPIPSMGAVQFEIEPTNAQPTGIVIPRGSRLHTQKIGTTPCRFRTGYPVTLWPIHLSEVRLQAPPFPPGLEPPPQTAAILRVQMECQGALTFENLQLDSLRFHLFGDSQVTGNLYELLFGHTLRVTFRSLEGGRRQTPTHFTPEECLHPVGFGADEGLLPYPPQSFLGYRLLTEFFSFPAKFLFFDLKGWTQAKVGLRRRAEVVFYLDREMANLEQEVGPQTFRLGCTPIVNLFEKTSEPITLSQARNEYPIVPDVHAPTGMEVYSVDKVTSVGPDETRTYQPFYGAKHSGSWIAQGDDAYWYASRRPSLLEGDHGTDVMLRLVDRSFNPRTPAEDVIVVETTCTNRDLPLKLQQLGEDLSMTLETAVPLRRILSIRPTPPLRTPLGRSTHWRLISHLMLNHLSLTDPADGRATLQEILRLYDFSDVETSQQVSSVNRNLIEGIVGLSSRPIVGQVESPTFTGFARGIEVTVELDEQKYIGTGMYLFSSVLERFLGLYASVNTLTQMVARTQGSDRFFKRWPPRGGEVFVL